METGVDPSPDITVLYSTSRDPIRFNELGNPIGTGTWSTTPPADITTIAAIQILTGPTVVLNSYDQLIVTIEGVAPVGIPMFQTAYNSFAVMANEVNGDIVTPLLPTEPNKVGVSIREVQNGSIGQFVWADYNENGIYDPGEPGVNGITVQLYDANQTLLATTVTANNNLNEPGYYLFNDLPAGNYFVKFIPYEEFTLTKQELNIPNGSTPDPTTGFTNLITLTTDQHILTINAGILGFLCPPPVIHANNKCLHQGDTFDPLTNVTAFDCQGNNITADIIVTQNNVNTTVVGVYTVTYSVTDSLEQTSMKTISVTVCVTSPYQLAIADLIESVALEQTAISHILNAEGEKLQAIVGIPNVTIDELLETNESVNSMINTIAKFELILQSKLELFKGNLCTPTDCCEQIENN